jgi:hypothetical protein
MSPVRVVVIDDRQDHLFAITNALSQSGIPCVWHLYDSKTNQLMPKPPDTGYLDIRLIITDLNIRNVSNASPDAKTLAGTLISDVLLPILPIKQIPYGLVLWSSVQGVIDQVRATILERIDMDESEDVDRRSKPLSIQLMNKEEFVSELPKGTEVSDPRALMLEAANGSNKIKTQLFTALNDPQLRLVCAWETRVSKASSAAVNEIFTAAIVHSKSNPMVGSTHAFQDILAKIANEAAGYESAPDDPVRALDEGLIDLFVDFLRSDKNDIGYFPLVKQSIGAKLGKRIAINSDVRQQLNTALHIEAQLEDQTSISRGLVLGCDDHNEIAQRVGYRTAHEAIWDEFLFPIESSTKLRVPAGTETNAQKEIRLNDLKKDVESNCRLRLVEVGADCDHANKKKRTVRLLCALEVPISYSDLIRSPKNGKKLKNDALMEWGPWNIGDPTGTHLLVSVKRFAIQQGRPLENGLKAKYRLRRPIVDIALRYYANHSSRLGYVSITE